VAEDQALREKRISLVHSLAGRWAVVSMCLPMLRRLSVSPEVAELVDDMMAADHDVREMFTELRTLL